MNIKSSEEKSAIKLSLASPCLSDQGLKPVYKVLKQNIYFLGERSVCVEQQIDDKTKKVEVILSSYHSAIEFR